ncbi:MAG: bile acid:sodium symporter family protein [Saprospiraceae bacterium]
MANIDDVIIHFNPGQVTILNLCLAYIMFGVALELSLSNFSYVFENKKSTWVGLFSQLIFLPLLTLGIIWVMKPHASLSLGMLLISVCPGGNVSNFAVHFAKGNTALSVILTGISTVTSSIQTPFTFAALFLLLPSTLQGDHIKFQVPFGEMVFTIMTLMILPLIAGMTVKKYWPNIQKIILPFVKVSSMILFIGIIIGGIYSNLDNIYQHLDKVFFIVLIHNTLALLSGYGIGKIFRLPIQDLKSISIETGIQNSGLALVLIFNFFNGLGGMALIAAWWSIWHLISAFTLSIFWRKIV